MSQKRYQSKNHKAQGNFSPKRVKCATVVSPLSLSLSSQATKDSSWLCLAKGTYALD